MSSTLAPPVHAPQFGCLFNHGSRHGRLFSSSPRFFSLQHTSRSIATTRRGQANVGVQTPPILLPDEEEEEEQEDEELLLTSDLSPFCPVPDFSTSSKHVVLLNPCKSCSFSGPRPLLVYSPGMDCTGQGIAKQLPYLIDAGYDVRCIYIPTANRFSWAKLTRTLIPILKEAAAHGDQIRHVTLLGESFGGALALHLARAAPDIISRLVLVNPATNLQISNPMASLIASTGLLAAFPEGAYKIAQDTLLPLMVNSKHVEMSQQQDIFSPVDLVPAACASWRLSLLLDNVGLMDEDLRSISIPSLVISSAEDRLLSSMQEGGRLQRLLRNAKRVILPHSGHTALLEDLVNLATIMETHGFSVPKYVDNSYLRTSTNPPASFTDDKSKVRDGMLDEMGRLLEPWRILTSPLVSGDENLPNPELNRPMLFVGNHTMFGVYDTPLLFHELFLRGFRCRGLAHPGHWKTSVGKIFERYGHVKATKLAAYRLLEKGERILLFPGGAREVCKRKGEEYKLLWKQQADFVRMASRFDAIIVPFATLGGDDAYKIIYDGEDLLKSPLGPVVRALYGQLDISLDTIYPVTAFPGTNIPIFGAIPSIERIYFHFAEPVDTALFNCREGGRKRYDEMYFLVKERVEKSIDMLKQVRATDEERNLQTRLLRKVTTLLPKIDRSKA